MDERLGDVYGHYEETSGGWGSVFYGFLVRVVAPVILLVGLALGAVYFRLLQGPASLPFLVAPIERGIAAEFADVRPRIDDVVVTIADGGGLEFRLVNLRLFETDGDLVAVAPSAAMQISVPALWGGRIVPSHVVFINPRVFLAYSKDDGLTLRFSAGEERSGPRSQPLSADSQLAGPPRRARAPGAEAHGARETAGAGGDAVAGTVNGASQATQSINLASLLSDASKRAREGGTATSYLREIGFRDANVVFDHSGRLTAWSVPRVSIDLDHGQDRSVASGLVTVASGRGPWSVSFRLEDSDRSSSFDATLAVRGLVPRTLGEALPAFALMRPWDLPVDGDVILNFSRAGALKSGRVDLEIGSGRLNLQTLSDLPIPIDAGLIKLSFDAQAQTVVMEPSTLRWYESSVTLVGQARADPGQKDPAAGAVPWIFDISARDGVIGLGEFSVPPVAIETWQASGAVWPARSLVELDVFDIAAGGGKMSFKGTFDASEVDFGTSFEGHVDGMPLATLKSFWPRGAASHARSWVGQHVRRGDLSTGTLKYLSGRFMTPNAAGVTNEHRIALALEFSGIEARHSDDGPMLAIPRALVRVENKTLEVAVPDALVSANTKKSIGIRGGRFTVVNLERQDAVGELVFKVDSELAPMVALLSAPSVAFFDPNDISLTDAAGKVAGDVRLTFPFISQLAAGDVKIAGKLRLTDGQASDVFGSYDIKGATLDFDVSESAMDARGEILLEGVVAKLNWQRIFNAGEGQQPPLRLTATLDNSDRRQLGIGFDGAVQGSVPVEVTISPRARADDVVRLRADLTNADLLIPAIAWHKRPGRSAFLECDLVWGGKYATVLENLRIAGDDIGAEGWAGINNKSEFVAFEFSSFTLDLVSRLKVSGQRKKGNVWAINAEGPTYDGRSFFRSLFSVGHVAGRAPTQKASAGGVDLTASIGNILGFEDVSLKNVTVKMSRRGGKLSGFKSRGTLSGGSPLDVDYKAGRGQPRLLVARSPDAGDVFRLVGFYPNLRGGTMQLEVELDGRGPAEKTGTLRVENFKILGDAIVSEVLSNAEDGRPSIATGQRGARQVVREVFPFDQMRAPFSVGYGQFVLEDAYLRGPLLGVTLRGKVDYKRRSLDIGGTYIPLQGINNVFRGVVVLGELLSGPRGEGLFGMTFAIQGGMERPQVIVNPFSVVAPGILREIFQLTPQDPRVQPRGKGRSDAGETWDVRSSSVPAAGVTVGEKSRTRGGGAAARDALDGWSARTNDAP